MVEMDSSASTDRVEKQGYLVKKGHIRHTWRTRWFVLRKNSLEYFKNRQDTRPKGRISLVGASLDCPNPDPNSTRPWMLILTTVEGKEYSIQAPDRDFRDEWKIALEEKIRRLDPSKRGLKRVVTLSRSLLVGENEADGGDMNLEELTKQREIISAMQDCSAGVKLRELRRGRLGRHVDRYFTGKDAVDWLIIWFFVSNRPEAVSLASSMLRNGLFHAIVPEEEGGRNGLSKSTIAEDKETCNDFQDSDNARYIFVSYVTSQSVEKLLFSDSDSEEVSSSPEPSVNISSRQLQTSESSDSDSDSHQDRVIRQGYLLKQGHVRKNWKIRRFVLLDTHLEYYRIEKVKTKPQGCIPLLGSKVSIPNDDSIPSIDHTHPKRHSLPSRLIFQTNGSGTCNKPHMFCVETSHNVKYMIQAESDEERLQWMSDIARQIEEVTEADANSRISPLV